MRWNEWGCAGETHRESGVDEHTRGSSVLRKDFVLIVGSSTETMYNS